MVIDKTSYIPRYYQLKEILEEQIRARKFKAGDKFPSERELSFQYKLNRLTVVKAISLLAEEGLVRREHGVGTFITEPRDKRPRRKTNTIGLILPDIKSSIVSEMCEGIEGAISKKGYKLVFHKISRNRKGKIDITVFKENIDGLLIIPPAEKIDKNSLWAFEKIKIPFVIMDRSRDGLTVDCVGVDNILGAYEAVSYLIELAHRSIAIILNEPPCPPVTDRLEGYKKALQKHHLKVNETLIINPKIRPWEDSCEAGYRSMRKVLRLKPRPTAAFVVSDHGAIGALKAIKEKGIRCPGDMSIVGFDDVPVASHVDPPLTTVAQPKHKIGERAVGLLTRRIEKELLNNPQQIILKPKLVIRKSCAQLSI